MKWNEHWAQTVAILCVSMFAFVWSCERAANIYFDWQERSQNIVDREEVEYRLARLEDGQDSLVTTLRILIGEITSHHNTSEHRWREMYQRHGMRWPSATRGLGESQPTPAEGVEGPSEVDH